MSRHWKVLLPVLVFAQVMVLVFMIAKQEYILNSGTKVILKCEPVDPRSLFSGDYVILNYTISRIDPAEVNSARKFNYDFKKNDTIYVALKNTPGRKYYEAAAVARNISDLEKDYSVIIRGRVQSSYGSLRVKYGVESYFVPQDEGKIIEKDLRDVTVEVSVTSKGESAISKLFLNEKEVLFY